MYYITRKCTNCGGYMTHSIEYKYGTANRVWNCNCGAHHHHIRENTCIEYKHTSLMVRKDKINYEI